MGLDPVLGAALPKIPGLDAAALKAVRNSLPGKLLGRTAAILAAAVLVLGFAELANARLADLGLILSPPWLLLGLLIGIPILIIAAQLLNEVRAERNRRAAVALAIKPGAVPDNYFRIGAYLGTDGNQEAFFRADRAHEKALAWVGHASSLPLYFSGDSGTGKSSLLNAFVLPALQKEGWTTISLRASQDAEAALTAALMPTRRARAGSVRELAEAAARRSGDRLLVVVDQFEEFIILGTPERQQTFASLLADLAERPVKGLKILLVLRSDYQTALDEMGLPRLVQGENFFQIGRFREAAARAFMRGSRLGLKDEPLDRLLKSAAELDDTPGMVRPITLNVLGYILQQRGGAVASSLDAGRLVRDYIAQVVENPAIRPWAPSVLEELLTEQGTKRARQESELATKTRLRPAEVRAVLHALAVAALARPLDATQGVWELSHDFVARAVGRYLGRRRGDPWRRAGAYAAPALLTLGMVAALATIEWNRLEPGKVRAELADLGIFVQPADKGGLAADATETFRAANLAAAAPLLKRLSVGALDLSNSRVTDLEPLKGLTSLQFLQLSDLPVVNLEPLRKLTALRQIDLSNTQVANLEPLKDLTALQKLDLTLAPVASLEPLKGLSALRDLDLTSTRVPTLEPLRGLATLQRLILSHAKVTSLEPLGALTALQQLDLSDTAVVDLAPLRRLTALKWLDLTTTRVADLEPLREMTSLQTLLLQDTQAANLLPLKSLTALTRLDLSGTQVADVQALQAMTGLRDLYLPFTQVAELAPLQGMTALRKLNLTGTRVTDVQPLRRTSALQVLFLMGTQVTNLEPLKGLTALQQIYLTGTYTKSLEGVQDLPSLEEIHVDGDLLPEQEVRRFAEYRSRHGLSHTSVVPMKALQ